ncbi:unnamed protein product [Porites lobata]|uniref:Uncharacterized protein n=1 Tax=Porites lobata TaxID=104759 RepID=A0ABN8RMZ0_9CNID|nr:unnamed protein product [Porites lobata]
MKDEEKASGINPEPTELEQALAEIIEMEEAAETEHQDGDGRRKEKDEADKHKAESMRKLAMEKLGETQKRAVEEGEQDCQKKKRRSGMIQLSICERKVRVTKYSKRKSCHSSVNNRNWKKKANLISRSAEIHDAVNAGATAAATGSN